MLAYAGDFVVLLGFGIACWMAYRNWRQWRAESAETKRLLSELDKTDPDKDRS